MENSKTLVLLVEDKENHIESVRKVFKLGCERIRLDVVRNLADARTHLKKFTPHLVIASYVLPDGKGIDLLSTHKARVPFPLLVLDKHGDTEVAVDVIKRGAVDYRVKSEQTLSDLPHICEKILREWGENRAQNRIHKQILVLSSVIQQISYSIIITDRSGDIEYVNPKFTQITGYTLEESIGKNPRFLKSGKLSPNIYQDMWKTIMSGKEWRGGFCNRKKSSELYWESAIISPIRDREGAITHFVAVKEDITEQKRTEEKLFQSEKLKSLGIVVSGIAHEFNNILAIIKGYAQFLEMYHQNESELKVGLSTISKASDDGAAIVRRMKDFVTADGSSMWFESVDINELIKHSIDYLMPKWKMIARGKGIGYKVDMKSLKDVSAVKGTPSELREVLINIINNALEAMPNGGTLSFRSWGKGKKVFVAISDTGRGMSEEVQKRMFDPFFTTRMPEGTGLGMSAVYGIIKRHNGEVSVESQLGVGSTILLELQATHKTVHSIISPRSINDEIGPLYVLVVEDEQETCQLLDKFFTKKGHNVKCVNSRNGAVELLKKEKFDLVLINVALKGDGEGGDLVKVFDSLDKRPKIGFMIDWRDKAKFMKSEHLKEDFVLRKPFDFSELSITIHVLFSNLGK
ncbi:MAG: response regulator [Candidatus Scalindua sp. AMX11]|nr:MAG: response regulator [Candidatus Scalindua sp.]NOG84795.1 response regulator [Planctomycetota bacterium]RZV98395.1 MAG: response regulator [Candidatus Scalindua sp. SCAELEC01]TDE66508.1 MAG: response regulator [Candidatus Scalindua sp. AMX11]GJQ58872.1 MAG: histidine kinase [Candidatus Scalindua sp.]